METPIKQNMLFNRAEYPNRNKGARSPKTTMEHNSEDGRDGSERIGEATPKHEIRNEQRKVTKCAQRGPDNQWSGHQKQHKTDRSEGNWSWNQDGKAGDKAQK